MMPIVVLYSQKIKSSHLTANSPVANLANNLGTMIVNFQASVTPVVKDRPLPLHHRK